MVMLIPACRNSRHNTTFYRLLIEVQKVLLLGFQFEKATGTYNEKWSICKPSKHIIIKRQSPISDLNTQTHEIKKLHQLYVNSASPYLQKFL